MSVLTPGGRGKDMSDLSHKGSAAKSVTIPTLTVAPVIDKAFPASAIAGQNLSIGKTSDEKTSHKIASSVSSTSTLSGYEKTAHVSPALPYSSEVDYQSDPADFFPLVSLYSLS